MNQAFFSLPKEKQQRIINGAMEVFSQYSYKRASTDDMAARAGISKGLLFYYFHNKQALYLFLFRYTIEQMERILLEQVVPLTTDFFELMEHGAAVKLALITESPYILDFCMRAYFDKESEAAGELNQLISEKVETIFSTYFTGIDTSKFRDDVDPQKVIQMFSWMAEGYLHEKQGRPLCTEEIMADFRTWSMYFKKMAYRQNDITQGGEANVCD